MQPYPSQPTSHTKRDTPLDKNSFYRTVTHTEFHKIFISPPQTAFPCVSLKNLFFCCLSPFFLLEPPNLLQKINKISIDSKIPPHRIVFCFKNIPFFGDRPIFLPHSNPLLPLQRYIHFQYRP